MVDVSIPGWESTGRTGHPPTMARTMLVRERLVERLGARWSVPVMTVTAPAGYGKTTLLAQAMEANADAPVGMDYLVTCTVGEMAVSQMGAELCRVLDAQPSSGAHGVAEVAQVVADAMWRRSPQPVALLFDDVHEIAQESEAAALIQAVVASLPANGHVVLAGRTEPPVRLARLEVEGRVIHLSQFDLMFTATEMDDFATLRETSKARIAACGGWPALAELYANGRVDVVDSYVDEEVLTAIPAASRHGVALLADVGRFDDEMAQAILGPGTDVAALLGELPLVGRSIDGQWQIHSLWQSLLMDDATLGEVQEARRRAGTTLIQRGRVPAGVELLLDAEAWDDFDDAVATVLGVAHPPVARDVLAHWFRRLPSQARNRPGGQLLAGVLHVDADHRQAWTMLSASEVAFRDRGHTAGEIAGLVQRGQLAWWSEDPDALAEAAMRSFELEAAGCQEIVPLACLGRALLHDIANDSRSMLAELAKITRGSLNDAWWGIVSWARAIGLLELGHTAEALDAADEALAHADLLHAPLAQTTRLQALWYQGNLTEVQVALPRVLREIGGSGYRHRTALVASECAMVHALLGQLDEATDALSQAQAAAVGFPEAPLIDTNLSLAEAALAAASGDDAAAAKVLTTHVERRPVRQGLVAAPQQRHLALFYVLVPDTRPVWDEADLGPAWAFGRDLARALVAVREGQKLPNSTPSLTDVDAVRAHLPAPWVAELGVAAVAAGRDDGWPLLDATWQASRPTVVHLAAGGKGSQVRAARDALARLPAPPSHRFELRLLGPIELYEDDALTQSADWRRQRVRSLLAYLTLHRTVSRDQLAESLWPGLDLDAQSRNLRVTLSYLLHLLEPGRERRDPSFFIRQHGHNITLHPGTWLTTDVWDFDAHAALAEEADRQGTPAATLDHALRAVELWRDEPTELACEPWIATELEERRLRFASLATRAGELLLARDEVDRARALAERAIGVDPWMEVAHRLVVATHLARDDQLAARRALQRYNDAATELGLTPAEATRMVERLLDSIPST